MREAHPLANLLPAMSEAEYAELLASIRTDGLLLPVLLHRDGRILDGRHRDRACDELGLDPDTVTFEGSDDEALAHVLALNLKRRHLSETQRAAIAADLATMRQGERTDLASIEARLSQPVAAGLLNVSRSAVQRAQVVKARGVPELFEAIRLDKLAVSLAATLADLPAEQQRQALARIEAGERSNHVVVSERRVERARTIEESASGLALNSFGRTFPVLYADPPWRFEGPPLTGSRMTELHYPTMTLADLCALPVADIAAPDSVLFMWALPSMIPEAIEVLTAWGFQWKTHGAWKKPRMSTGFWLRNTLEDIIIATRGNMVPPAHIDAFLFEAPAGRHSEKPDEVRERIGELYPDCGKIELFARTAAPGWHVWGNQAPATAEELA
jgi:N6-adenosine-specific RNA methylase IME4/ParB-like chromosome segregation protein Spo0J